MFIALMKGTGLLVASDTSSAQTLGSLTFKDTAGTARSRGWDTIGGLRPFTDSFPSSLWLTLVLLGYWFHSPATRPLAASVQNDDKDSFSPDYASHGRTLVGFVGSPAHPYSLSGPGWWSAEYIHMPKFIEFCPEDFCTFRSYTSIKNTKCEKGRKVLCS